MVFSTVLTSHQNVERQTSQGYIPSGFGKKKKKSMCTVSQYGLGSWEGSLITEGGPAMASQERRHLIFIFNMAILYL